MNIVCQKCGGLGVADVTAGESIECAHCQHVGPAVAAPVNRKPVRGGGVVRLFGLLVFVGGFGAMTYSTTVGVGVILSGLLLHIIGQLDLTNAHLARLNEREP